MSYWFYRICIGSLVAWDSSENTVLYMYDIAQIYISKVFLFFIISMKLLYLLGYRGFIIFLMNKHYCRSPSIPLEIYLVFQVLKQDARNFSFVKYHAHAIRFALSFRK